jgi:peptidyl-prolyl cis-trans isomerase C
MENVNTALTVAKISFFVALGVVFFLVVKPSSDFHGAVATGSESVAPAEPAAPAAPAGGVVIARVNGQAVYREDMMAAYQALPPQAQQLGMDVIYPMLIERLVDEKLLAVAAGEAIQDTDREFQDKLRGLRERVKTEVYLTRALDAAVTEEKLRERYEEAVAAIPPQEEVRARHILLDSEERANEVLLIVQGGADFAKTAKEHSTGPSGPNGGDLGYFAKDQMVAPFAEAAFAMPVGEFSPAPVQTEFGWHLIKVEDRRQSPPPAFEEMREQISEEIRRTVLTAMLADARSGAEIEIFDIDGNPPAEAPAVEAGELEPPQQPQ